MEQLKVVKLKEFFQPMELLAKYPNCGWSVHQIGHLASAGIITGFKPRGGSCNLIYEPSFVAALEYTKTVEKVAVDYSD